MCRLFFVGLSSGNDADSFPVLSMAMADDEYGQPETYTQHDEALFVHGMIWVEELQGVLVEKYCLCIFKGNAMLPAVLAAF